MNWMMSSAAVLIAAGLSVAASAQSSGTMAKSDKMAMDKNARTDETYTGCIEKGASERTFTLTHVATADHMGKDAMDKGAMKKDTMSKDAMNKGGMMPTTLMLSSASVDFGEHVGHKVSIVGSAAHENMEGMAKEPMAKDSMGKGAAVLSVKSLKMISTSCS